jgi:large subunit ribosomal protein L5
MALRELPYRTATALCRDARPTVHAIPPLFRRNASTDAAPEVETTSFADAAAKPEAVVKDFDPIARSRARRRGKKQLPPSR